MNLRRMIAVYSVAVGSSMIVAWPVWLAMGQVPMATEEPVEFGFLLAAELLTGGTAILAGFGLWMRRRWGTQAYFVSAGLLLYTATYTTGVFLQHGPSGVFLYFAAVAVLTASLLATWISRTSVRERVPKEEAMEPDL